MNLTSSLHEYLGKIYHGKNDLTEEEYELSKKLHLILYTVALMMI